MTTNRRRQPRFDAGGGGTENRRRAVNDQERCRVSAGCGDACGGPDPRGGHERPDCDGDAMPGPIAPVAPGSGAASTSTSRTPPAMTRGTTSAAPTTGSIAPTTTVAVRRQCRLPRQRRPQPPQRRQRQRQQRQPLRQRHPRQPPLARPADATCALSPASAFSFAAERGPKPA